MNVSWDTPLKPWQKANPIVEARVLEIDNRWQVPSTRDLLRVFPAGHSLKTWGKGLGTDHHLSAHWIGVKKQTPIHTDPKYPRYTHHLILRADNFVLRGIDKVECPVVRGSYIVADTHSPHQLFAKSKDALWYVGVSVDADEPMPADMVLPRLFDYAINAPFLNAEIVQPNNGGRFKTKA